MDAPPGIRDRATSGVVDGTTGVDRVRSRTASADRRYNIFDIILGQLYIGRVPCWIESGFVEFVSGAKGAGVRYRGPTRAASRTEQYRGVPIPRWPSWHRSVSRIVHTESIRLEVSTSTVAPAGIATSGARRWQARSSRTAFDSPESSRGNNRSRLPLRGAGKPSYRFEPLLPVLSPSPNRHTREQIPP